MQQRGERTMFLWEMLAQRLRRDGWLVWHRTESRSAEPTYVVHLHRAGVAWRASAPTLTEAFAEASRQARRLGGTPQNLGGPHFAMATRAARA
jgi:hypothetical protein